LRAKVYRLFYRLISPYLPNSSFCQYIKWKSALLLVGDEFHSSNLAQNQAKLAKHFEHDTPLQPDLAELLTCSKTSLKILDVGAGPVSKVGKVYNGYPIELVPIDPMASRYQEILTSINLKPKFWTKPGNGESLSQQFVKDSFDMIHARNSIDHTLNPLKVIKEALHVLKPEHFFYMNHYRNEGSAANYYGLHQWNFDIEDGSFVIKNRYGESTNVNKAIESIATVHHFSVTEQRLVLVLKKL